MPPISGGSEADPPLLVSTSRAVSVDTHNVATMIVHIVNLGNTFAMEECLEIKDYPDSSYLLKQYYIIFLPNFLLNKKTTTLVVGSCWWRWGELNPCLEVMSIHVYHYSVVYWPLRPLFSQGWQRRLLRQQAAVTFSSICFDLPFSTGVVTSGCDLVSLGFRDCALGSKGESALFCHIEST